MKNSNNQRAEDLLTIVAQHGPQSIEASKAFTQFYSLYQKRIIAICLKNCWRYHVPSPEEEAKDISQEVMLKIFFSAHTFNPAVAKLSTWIWTIIRNTMFDHLRYIRKLNLEYLEVLEQNQETTSPHFQEKNVPFVDDTELETDGNIRLKFDLNGVNKAPNLNKVIEAMKNLPEVQEDILRTTLLNAPNDMPGAERKRIALRYGIADASIDTYRSRAKKRLEVKFGVPINWNSLKECISKITDSDKT